MIKELLIVIILLGNITWSSAQLTNGQVYNYEVGDVHQIRGIYISGGSGSVTTQTDTVIYKSYSVGLDSITYHIKRQMYDPPVIFGAPPIYTESVDTLLITNLNQPANHFTANSCLTPTDTSFTDTCGVYYERLSSDFDSSCFEPNFWYSKLYSGLGGPYHYESSTVGGYNVTWKLVYHNTVQNGECGTPAVFASVDEKELSKLKIYPNPSKGEIKIELSNSNSGSYSVSVFDVFGSQIMELKMESNFELIDLKNYSSGVYFVQLSNDNEVVSRERVVLY